MGIDDDEVFQANLLVFLAFKDLIQPKPGSLIGLILLNHIKKTKTSLLYLSGFGRQNTFLEPLGDVVLDGHLGIEYHS